MAEMDTEARQGGCGVNGEHSNTPIHPSTDRETPRNRGLIARDLTLACYSAWRPGQNFYGGGGYTLDLYPEVAKAEREVCDRIGDLEEEVRRQAQIIERMQEAASELQTQIAAVIKLVGVAKRLHEEFI
jgi:hypothetical protein